MNKKIVKSLLKFLFIAITAIIVIGCSNSKEATKKYIQEDSESTVEITLFYTKDSDTLLKQETKLTVKKLPEDTDKETAIKILEYAMEKYKGDGISMTVEEANNEIVVVQTVDYTKVDIEKAKELRLDGSLNEDNKTYSLSKTEELLKLGGFREA